MSTEARRRRKWKTEKNNERRVIKEESERGRREVGEYLFSSPQQQT